MKAMILAAGLGTRLLPFTSHTPKPLFSISGQAILDRTIQKLQFAGADADADRQPHELQHLFRNAPGLFKGVLLVTVAGPGHHIFHQCVFEESFRSIDFNFARVDFLFAHHSGNTSKMINKKRNAEEAEYALGILDEVLREVDDDRHAAR